MAVLEALTEEEKYLWAILSDPSGLDQAEFLWYAQDHEYGCFRAWDFQHAWWRSTEPLTIDQCARSLGKALDISTKVLTTNGWSTMGELVVGDEVFGLDGKPTRVAEAFDYLYDRECFKVVFDDKSEIIADRDHLWTTWDKKNRNRPGSSQVRTTGEILATLKVGKENNHSVEVALPLQMQKNELGLDPYLFGYWLGDGDSVGARLTIGNEDFLESSKIIGATGHILKKLSGPNHFKIEVIGETDWTHLPELPPLKEREYTFSDTEVRNARISVFNGSSITAVAKELKTNASSISQWVRGSGRIEAGGPIRTRNGAVSVVGEKLHSLGVINNKHIPKEYMNASYDQRLSLLQGLMDSDGHVTKTNRCEITQKSEELARQIYILIASLGQKPFWEEKIAYCNGVDAGLVYRVGFTPSSIQPFRLKRKADRVKLEKGSTRVTQRRIIDVQPVSTRPVRCISVEAEDSLFLVGETFIPTHNSLSLQVKACAFALLHPAHEMVITAPEGIHLQAVTDLIETRLLSVRLYREMLINNQNNGITHRPLLVKFKNAARIMGRIPQRDGRGIKGTHPLHLEIDEAQDYPEPGWTEIGETLKRGHAGATQRIHGVTKGVEDTFKKLTEPDSAYHVFRFTAMHRPTWTMEERAEKIGLYGSADHPDYRRNILGLHGDTTNPLFVLHRLIKCFDLDATSDYNTNEYYHVKISDEMINDYGGDILNIPTPPGTHQSYPLCWIGMDVGYVKDPSEIMIFSEYRKNKSSKEANMKLIARYSLDRVKNPDQVRLISWMFENYNVAMFALDSTGAGLPLFQDLQGKLDNRHMDKIKGYNFSSKIVVGFDETIPIDEFGGKKVEDTAIKKNVLDFSTDVLREYVDSQRLEMPDDREVLKEFQGQTWRNTVNNANQERLYCVDTETEILTDRGWLRHNQILEGDSAWSYNNRKSEWAKILNVHSFEHSGPMVKMGNVTHDSLSTLNHKWPIERLRTNHVNDRYWWHYKGLYETQDIPNITRYRIPIAAEANITVEPKYSDEFVEIVGWYLTEGCYQLRAVTPQLTIVQSYRKNPKFCAMIDNALNKLNTKWSKTLGKSGCYTYRIQGWVRDELVKFGPDKIVPPSFLTELSYDQLILFIDTCIRGDGWISTGTDKRVDGSFANTQYSFIGFSQKNKEITDLFGMACSMVGMATSYRSYDHMDYQMHSCTIRSSEGIPTNNLNQEIVDYKGLVWCPETSNGTWFARRNGKVFFTGNSSGLFHALDACRMAVLAHKLHGLDLLLRNEKKVKKAEPVFDIFI